MQRPRLPLRSSLFRKYFLVLFAAVAVPLLASGIGNAWFGYRDQRAMLGKLLQVEAAAAALRIEGFLDGIREQLGWAVQLPWEAGSEDRHRLDALRVLRQAPAAVSIALIDRAGIERLRVSRVDLNSAGTGVDRSGDPAVLGARAAPVWYGPVYYLHGSEPFMTMAVAGNRRSVGIAIAEINLKLIWEVLALVHVGRSGHAFVLDRRGRLIAHPDISRVLSGTDEPTALALRALRDRVVQAGGDAVLTQSTRGQRAVVAMASVAGVDWSVFVEQPTDEAFASIRAALWHTAGLMLVGGLLAAALAAWLARRMTGPIRLLEEGAERIGAGRFDHRIDIRSGDELERLAAGFNRMAQELALAQERAERIARLKRFLAPEVAEIVEQSGGDGMLAGQRADVVAVFCDLRGFTALSARAEPEEVMEILHDYFAALGQVIARHAATLTSFAGDGLMVLVNAPVVRPDPAFRAVAMAAEMQAVVQELVRGWRSRGYGIGFGVGLAMGPATVGQIGTASRAEYTAIGNVVNLAARLCAEAADGQILVDQAIADAVADRLPLAALGARRLKGYEQSVRIYDAHAAAGVRAAAAGGDGRT